MAEDRGRRGPPRPGGRRRDGPGKPPEAAARGPRRPEGPPRPKEPDAGGGGRRLARTSRPAGREAPAPGRGERIAKLLARAGVGSRRDIERMIAEGRVAVDGTVLDTPAVLLKSLAQVTVDGRPVGEAEASRLFLFHKPAGVLTAARDPSGRPTIYDILPAGLPRLMPVGRLDLNTEGLLLLTNDGELKRALELPASGVPRTYRVRAMGQVRQPDLERLATGITVEGMHYGPIDASIDRRATTGGANIWLTMTLAEGRNREVRRVCEALGLKVSRLIRVRYGPCLLGDLPVRGIVEASPAVIGELRGLARRARPA